MAKLIKSSLLIALAATTATPAYAQLQKGEKPTEQQIATGEAPATAFSEAETVYRGLQGSMVARKWTRGAAEELLGYIDSAGDEGLLPADYAPDALRAALGGRDEVALDRAATDSFLRLSA